MISLSDKVETIRWAAEEDASRPYKIVYEWASNGRLSYFEFCVLLTEINEIERKSGTYANIGWNNR